jgi:hypothetical protein
MEHRGAGPPRAFGRKNAKLNTKSPWAVDAPQERMRCAGADVGRAGLVLDATAAGPRTQPRTSLRGIPKTFFWAARRQCLSRRALGVGAAASAAVVGSRGGGGFKSLPGRAPRPRWSPCADFFSARGLLNHCPEINAIKRPRKSLDLRTFRRPRSEFTSAARGNRGFIFWSVRSGVLTKIAAKFRVGG